MTDDTIYRQAAIDVLNKLDVSDGVGISAIACDLQGEAICSIKNLPSVESEIAEKLYQYKCYITDESGLQHEVIHIGDIKRVTGWEI